MSVKKAMQMVIRHILNGDIDSYDELNDEQNAIVVAFETELWKEKVDELRDKMSPEEIKKIIHDKWWMNYEIADGTEENLLAYV